MVQSLEGQLESVREKEGEILGKIEEQNARKMIDCSCDGRHRIKGLILIQTKSYVSPSGCTEGAYWVSGEMQFVCPTTRDVNRLMFSVPYEDRGKHEKDPEEQFGRKYGHLFKEVIVGFRRTGSMGQAEYTYRKGDEFLDNESVTTGEWVNNYSVDLNRRRFGLVEARANSD